MFRGLSKVFFAFSLLTCSASALSAEPSSGIRFDCDVPADHYSSVSQDLVGVPMIKGSVRAIELRSGNNLPVAGARIVSADGKRAVGFQLIAASPRAEQFDVVLYTKAGESSNRRTVTVVAAKSDSQFSLGIADTGKATLVIGGTGFDAEFEPMPGASGMVFCSTGQFKFSDLAFSAN